MPAALVSAMTLGRVSPIREASIMNSTPLGL